MASCEAEMNWEDFVNDGRGVAMGPFLTNGLALPPSTRLIRRGLPLSRLLLSPDPAPSDSYPHASALLVAM